MGGGKYSAEVTRFRERIGLGGALLPHAAPAGVVCIVIGGPRGPSFEVQAVPLVTAMLPGLLRQMANDIEKDLEGTE